jgi:diguanylate cyclase (GGDEF)-like protein
MVHDGSELGVLVAVFPKDRGLEEGRRKILASFAAQVASAMHNVNHSDLQRLLSVTDGMTGLHNFRYLSMFINRELNKSRRYGHELSLAIFDLDDFKLVNDLHGHHVGDEVLKAVADTLVASVRGADMVARYGGEEFVVVFPETSKHPAEVASEKLREAISAISLPSHPDLKITVSVGVANYPGDASDRAGIMVKADEALYSSKRAGKNRVTAA